MLRDRIVCGINDEKIQNRLLSETTLTYQKALSLSQSSETAANNMKELQKKQPSEESSSGDQAAGVNQVGGKKPKPTCFRCGKEGHLVPKCKHKKAVCHQCGKQGYIPAVCRGKPKKTGPPNKKTPPKKVGQVGEETEDEDYFLFNVNAVNEVSPRPPIVDVEIEDKSVPRELDTGSAYSLLSEKTFRELWPEAP